MSRVKGPIPPRDDPAFFVGWEAKTADVDRRFLLGLGLGLVGVGAVTAAGLAAAQNRPGPGTWDQGDVRDFVGRLITDPYPALLVSAQINLDGQAREDGALARPSLLGCLGKCGVRPRLEAAEAAAENGMIAVRGTLIERGGDTMISVIDGADWARSAEAHETPTLDGEPTPVAVTVGSSATLRGEILDAKCWFGAMRPNTGKVHKACATLCIASGLPPVFLARGSLVGGEGWSLLTGPDGEPVSHEILPFVADPISAAGQFVRRDFPEFRVDPSQIRRL